MGFTGIFDISPGSGENNQLGLSSGEFRDVVDYVESAEGGQGFIPRSLPKRDQIFF